MEEHEIPGTSVKVVRVAGDDANAFGSQTGKSAAKHKRPRYRTTEEKVKDIERYLIWQVDSIRRWLVVAVGISTISAAAVIALLLTVLNAPDGESVTGRGVGADDETKGRAAAAGTADVAPKGQPAADRVQPKTRATAGGAVPKKDSAADAVEPKAMAAAADVAPKADHLAAGAPEEPGLAIDSETRPQQGVAVSVPADPGGAAEADRAAAETEPPPSEPPGQGLAEGASAAAVNDTTAGPIPSPSSAPAAGKSESSFRVGASAIASRMAGLVPRGTADRFPASQKRLYCWTRIESDSFSQVPRNRRYVIHRWIHKGEAVRERKITIGSPRYRAYSVLPSPGDRRGEWRVEIIDAKGRVIGTEKFVIQ